MVRPKLIPALLNVWLVALLAACAAPRTVAPVAEAEQRYDLLITGGTVLDGTGAPGYRADVAVRGDRVVRISRTPLPPASAARVIDATGQIVAPGFVDLHAHLDPLLRLPDAESMLRQGVTTALGGPDGGSPWPIGAYLDSAQAAGLGINVAFLAGHNTIRREVTGMDNRAPTPAELARMRGMVAQAMGEGAWGLSTGLKYLPGAYSELGEVVALAEAAADSGGIYTSHLREEGLGLIEAVAEAIEIGRRADIPVVLTHHKVVGQPMWGASRQTLAMIDSARAAGIDVMADQYPYTATYTGISVLVPAWAMAGGDTAFARRLEDPVLRDSVVAGIVFNILNDRGGGDLARVQLARVEWMPELEGKTLRDWAEMRGMSPTPETGAELVIEAMRRGGASAIYHVLDEQDVNRIMRHPQTMIASDGRLVRPGEGHPHPRWYGTFPRVLGRYARDQGVLSLEQAVHKMTGTPAARLGLRDRGRLTEGAYADLVVFDPARVTDRATFEEPHQYPEGIPYVVVNGAVAVDAGQITTARAGRVLRRGADGRPVGGSARAALPRVHLLATGGTISNLGDGERLTGEQIARAVPGLDTLANVTVEQFSNVASGSITPDDWRRMALRIRDLYREDPNLRGVIVTHGTDTIEETTYFLDLTVGDCRPVVVTGAMRRANDVGADGLANLLDAVQVILAPEAKARGTLLVMNDEIFAARDVTKANTSRPDAFVAPGKGPIGMADPDRVVFHRDPPRASCDAAFRITEATALPRVDIVYSYSGADGTAIDALVGAGAKGLVVASVGRGGTTPPQREALNRATEKGVFVVTSSRTGGGRVPVRANAAQEDWRPGLGAMFGAGDLNPQKARVLLMLALAQTGDAQQIADAFERF